MTKQSSQFIAQLFVFALIAPCGFGQDNDFQITAQLSGFPDSTVIQLENLSTGQILDSAFVIDGNCSFGGSLGDTPEILWLTFKVGNKPSYLKLLIGNESIQIKGELTDFPYTVSVRGSSTQNDLNELTKHIGSFAFERDTLANHFFTLPKEERKNMQNIIWDRIDILQQKIDSTKHAYIIDHPNSFAALIHLDYLKTTMSKDSLRAIFNRFNPALMESKFAKPIDVYLKHKIAAEGDLFYDFMALNQHGDSVQFSTLIGPYTLIDFSSVYCGFCKKAKRELVDLSHEIDSLQLVSYSVDPLKSTWQGGLKRDDTSWLSLWDGEGKFSETYIKYGVEGIPAFVLIDPNGKIIDKWSGYRKGLLREKLSDFLTP